jgi:beta-lactam-binding protein with PASTA domain
MAGKPHLLVALLIGFLTLSISLAAVNEYSKHKATPSERASISRPALTVKAHVPEEATPPDLPQETSSRPADHGGNMAAARRALDAMPTNPPPVVEGDRPLRSLAVSRDSPATASPLIQNIAHAAPANLVESARNPSLPAASATAPASKPDAAPNSAPNPADAGLPQRKVPLFANPTVERFSPPPPPVLNTPTENKDTVSNGGGDPLNPDDGAGNTPPSADPGADRMVFVGDSVTLDGSGSADPDGDALAFKWSFVSRPAQSLSSVADPSAAISSFTADVAGVFIVQLVVDDGSEESLPQLVVITAEIRGVTVPDVVGLSLTEARKLLIDAGLKQIRINSLPNPNIPKNQVVEQQPAAQSPVQDGSAVSLVISLSPQEDDDQDGLPDAWEYAKFGNLDQRDNQDSDGDGYTNHQEYLVGTDPADRAEAPVPAGNFFEYDAFGRILVKQVTLEP